MLHSHSRSSLLRRHHLLHERCLQHDAVWLDPGMSCMVSMDQDFESEWIWPMGHMGCCPLSTGPCFNWLPIRICEVELAQLHAWPGLACVLELLREVNGVCIKREQHLCSYTPILRRPWISVVFEFQRPAAFTPPCSSTICADSVLPSPGFELQTLVLAAKRILMLGISKMFVCF